MALLGWIAAAMLCAQTPSAAELYARGRKAERAGHMAEAYLMYSQAAAMSPGTKLYWERSKAVEMRASLEAKTAPREIGLDPAPNPSPIQTPIETITLPGGDTAGQVRRAPHAAPHPTACEAGPAELRHHGHV